MAGITDTVTIERIASAITAKMQSSYVCQQASRIAVLEVRANDNTVDINEVKMAVKDAANAARAVSDSMLVMGGKVKVMEAGGQVQTLKLEKKMLAAFALLSVAGGAGASAAFKVIAKLFGG